MAKIPGTPVGTTMPRTDFNQTDPTKADYLKGREHIATKEEWIKIADTTLTEAVESVEVWLNDDNGKLVDFKKVRGFVKINGDFNETGYTTWVSFMPNIATYAGACRLPSGTVLNGTDRGVYAEAEIKMNGICEGYSSFTSPINNIQVVRRVSEMPSIKTFRFNLNNGILIPTGTTIIVEGLKA